MKRPLLPVALLYIGGILCGEYLHPALPVLFGVSFLAVGLAVAFERVRPRLCALLVVLMGWTGQGWHSAILAPDDLRTEVGQQTGEAKLRGGLQTLPVQRIYERGGHEVSRSSALIEADEIFLDGKWLPAYGRVIATVAGNLSSSFFETQRVEVAGVIQRPDGPLA